jgi:hypothetical protein
MTKRQLERQLRTLLKRYQETDDYNRSSLKFIMKRMLKDYESLIEKGA